MDHAWTDQQAQIIAIDLAPGNVVLVQAGAGCGKTSVLAEHARQHPDTTRLYVAYNRAVADEAQRRLGPSGVRCTTFHQMVYTHGENDMHVRIDPDAEKRPTWEDELAASVADGPAGRQAVHALRNYCFSTDASEPPGAVATHVKDAPAQLGPPQPLPAVEQAARLLWERSTADGALCPFFVAEKHYVLSKPRLDYRYIYVDEAQDLNPNMFAVLLAQRPHATLLFVGDPHQQIYSFRGTTNAFLSIRPNLHLRLTQSFRSGADLTSGASKLLFDNATRRDTVQPLQGRPQHQTTVRLHHYDRDTQCPCRAFGSPPAQLPDELWVLSRKNITLVNMLWAAMRCPYAARHSVRVAGAEVRTDGDEGPVVHFGPLAECRAEAQVIATMGAGDYHAMVREGGGAWRRGLGGAFVTKHGLESLAAVMAIENFLLRPPPSPPTPTIVLTTAHRAKGLEFDHVMLAPDFRGGASINRVAANSRAPLPERMARRQEEVNIAYTAITRARRTLVLCHKEFGRFFVRSSAAAAQNKRPHSASSIAGQRTLESVLADKRYRLNDG